MEAFQSRHAIGVSEGMLGREEVDTILNPRLEGDNVTRLCQPFGGQQETLSVYRC